EAGEEADRQQVEEALEHAHHAVLGLPMPAGPVANHDLADAEPARMRQHRDETVQLAVDADLVEHLAAVDPEAAAVVVPAAAGQRADHRVEDAAGIDLVPGVVPDLLPAANHVVASIQLVEEAGDLGGVVLEVAVHGEDERAARGLEAGDKRGRLAEIAAEPD